MKIPHEGKESRERSWPLNKYILEALKYRDGVSLAQIMEGTGLKEGAIRKAFNRKGVQKTTIKKIAAFFHVGVEDLKMGIISPMDAGEAVLAAYRLVTQDLARSGKLSNVPREDNFMDAVKEWKNKEFQDFDLSDGEYVRLFALLNGPYVIRTSDDRYERLPRNVCECYLYVDLLSVTTKTLSTETGTDQAPVVTQFMWGHERSRQCKNAMDYFNKHRDIITAFAVQHPHVRAWVLECWSQLHLAFDNCQRDPRYKAKMRVLDDQLQILYDLLGNVHAFTPCTLSDHLEKNRLIMCLSEYFDALREVVIVGVEQE